jgi:hypothetical protein
LAAIDHLDRGLAKLNNSISLMADKVAVLKSLGRTVEAAALAKQTSEGTIASSRHAVHAITTLLDAGFDADAKTLLTRAERETPAKPLKMIRTILDLKERPDAMKLLIKRNRGRILGLRLKALIQQNPISVLIKRLGKKKK